MPQLVNGIWQKGDVAASETKNGAFVREPTRFRSWITADGSDGPEGQPGLKAEAGRYHLYAAWICPWASRVLAMRNLKGLDWVIGLSLSKPELTDNGWTFLDENGKSTDSANGISYLYQLYVMADPTYSGKVSVPVLWDRKEGTIVNNESADIIRMLNSGFDTITGNTSDFYPVPLRDQIDHWSNHIYDTVNNGVYRAGFAQRQDVYEQAFDTLFQTLDELETHLGTSRYLAGAYLTEADIRLFVTLIRFDAAYFGAFKCNLRRISDYPALSAYTRELYQIPQIGSTVRIDHIKRGYYSIAHLNPNGIVPKGPLQDFSVSHGRDHLAGRGIWQKPA